MKSVALEVVQAKDPQTPFLYGISNFNVIDLKSPLFLLAKTIALDTLSLILTPLSLPANLNLLSTPVKELIGFSKLAL